MTEAHPGRHRERLVLSLDDEGLEDLTLRLVLPDWPNAHRTHRGPDGGVDVFSDHDLPPQRAWQCKNYADNGVDWVKCRNSLTTALAAERPPLHYTFVFPRLLKKSDHDYWRETFVPWAKQNFAAGLPALDYWDDLADRLKDRPDLVDQLNDGALGVYIRKVSAQTNADGVNPLATAADLIDDGAKIAERAETIGKADPYFAYGEGGREANATDSKLQADRPRFTMDRSRDDALPRYTMEVRRDDRVHEFTASPREGVQLPATQLRFADSDGGSSLRDHAREELAKGHTVTLHDPNVRLDPGGVPDKFRYLTDADGLLHDGELTLGVSEPLPLEVTLHKGAAILPVEIPLHRIPELPGDRTAWGGSLGGAIFTIDLRPTPAGSGPTDEVEIILSVGAGFDGESPHHALQGLSFVRAFAEAESTRLECDGLLQPGGVTIPGPGAPDPDSHASLMANGLIAQALAELELRDRRGRTMPASITQRDAAVAKTIVELFRNGVVPDDISDEGFEVPLPSDADPADDLTNWMSHVVPMPDLAGRPTLSVIVTVENATPLRITDASDGQRILVCRNNGGASVVMRLHDFDE